LSPNEFSLKRVLVPVDFSVRSANALAYAVALGSARGAELDVLHVWHSDLSTPVTVAKERAKNELREFVSGLELRGDVLLRRRTDHGDPYLTIQRLAQLSAYDLIVVAGPEPGRADADSVSRSLLGTAPGPVLFVPSNAKPRFRSDQDRALKLERVLVPLALAGASLEALAHADILAKSEHAIVEVLLTPDVPADYLARFRARPALERAEVHEATEASAVAVPKRMHASRLDLLVLAGPRAQLGSRPSDQRVERMALGQQCPSWCVAQIFSIAG
jgi:nucleotide-binding universal stress UspA family protein